MCLINFYFEENSVLCIIFVSATLLFEVGLRVVVFLFISHYHRSHVKAWYNGEETELCWIKYNQWPSGCFDGLYFCEDEDV